jgi:acetolactate synthase-1/2/3 large subunit
MPPLRDYIVSRLQQAGVRALFGVPGGGGNLDLVDAAERAGLPFVLTATETGGALAAIAQFEVTQQPGACLTTLGPGAASVANGVACAFLDRASILVFTDCHASASAGAYEHQQIDQQSFFTPITKWSRQLTPDRAQATFEEALACVLDAPPGPVHLSWPEDLESACGPSERPEGSPAEPNTRAAEPISPAFENALADARRPVAIVGLGARQPGDAPAIRKLIETHNIPALVSYKAKGVIPDDHPCYAGVFTNAIMERPIVSASDLVLAVGLDPVELLPRPWPYPQPCFYVGRWPVANRQVPFAVQHIGEIPAAVNRITAALKHSDWDLEDVRQQLAGQRRAIDTGSTNSGMTAQQVVRTAAQRLSRDWRVTVDAGAHMFPATMMWPCREPNLMLISNGLSTMGFALPAAIGAALADRGRPVVALTGDGGLLMCAAELLTAVREKLRIVTIVFSDDSLSLIEIKQQRRRYTPSGVALGSVGWPKLAEGFGVAAFTAANASELDAAIAQAVSESGPSLIEARIDRSNYARTLELIRG